MRQDRARLCPLMTHRDVTARNDYVLQSDWTATIFFRVREISLASQTLTQGEGSGQTAIVELWQSNFHCPRTLKWVLSKHTTHAWFTLASSPGLPRERGKAWYALFTHARIFKNDASQKIVGMYVNSVPFSLHSGPSGYKNRLRVFSTNLRCRYSAVSNRALNLRV